MNASLSERREETMELEVLKEAMTKTIWKLGYGADNTYVVGTDIHDDYNPNLGAHANPKWLELGQKSIRNV